jgi:hypothetical protein
VAGLGFAFGRPSARLESDPPLQVRDFADAVFLADGLDPTTADPSVYRQVSAAIRAAFGQAASRSDSIDLIVLDALANDIEGFSDVLRLVNHPTIGWADELGRDFEPADIALSLVRLIRDGSVEACYASDSGTELLGAGDRVGPPVPLTDLWYRMTARGRLRHTDWASSDPG